MPGTNVEARRSDEMMNEDPSDQVNEGASTSQAGRGEKRTHDEVDDEDEDERPYAIEGVKEVNIKKFRTKGTNYSLRFNNAWPMLNLRTYTNDFTTYSSTFWTIPLAMFRPAIRFEWLFIPLN